MSCANAETCAILHRMDTTRIENLLAPVPAPASKYHTIVARLELVAPDGSVQNYSVNQNMLDDGYADRYPDHTLRLMYDQRAATADQRLLMDSGIPEENWPLLRADARRMTNMVPGQRFSDSMRSSIRAFRNGTLTQDSFNAARVA